MSINSRYSSKKYREKNMWNWEHKNWPNFEYTLPFIQEREEKFLYNLGKFSGVFETISKEERDELLLECVSDEAMNTSKIEGEFLERESLQSSLRRSFGLKADARKSLPKEFGIAEMMSNLYKNAILPLSEKQLFQWHTSLMNGRQDIEKIGAYRTHSDPMQILSGSFGNIKIHFEAPPSSYIESEMEKFFQWYHSCNLSPLVKSSIAHLYFTSIHPFEDGNGRIGRAISEKIISEFSGKSVLISLSSVIESRKKEYYKYLELNNKGLEISEWIDFFSQVILEAQELTQKRIQFLCKKSKFYYTHFDSLNSRQQKCISRIFQEGIKGFTGGISAQKYVSITGTSPATATRDLQNLVEKNIFSVTGKSKATRYWLKI